LPTPQSITSLFQGIHNVTIPQDLPFLRLLDSVFSLQPDHPTAQLGDPILSITRQQNELIALLIAQTASDTPISPECWAACELAINLIFQQRPDRVLARHIQ
jgi:hypothetical protein